MAAPGSSRLTTKVARTCVRTMGGRLCSRLFSTSEARSLDPLLNMSGMAIAKESQYLSKLRRIPRVEFAPHLELIRSSEVDPFAPIAGASPTVVAALQRAARGESDLKTAYVLAVQNLTDQVRQAQHENYMMRIRLETMRETNNRQATHVLVLVVFSAFVTAYTVANPDKAKAFIEWFREADADLKAKWANFDWRWLGNPPSHTVKPEKRILELSMSSGEPQHVMTIPTNVSKSTQTIENARPPAHERKVYETPAQPAPSFVARLFWANPTRT